MKTIGEKLKFLRQKANFTQNQLASYLGIDQTTLSKIESGERNISVDSLEQLSILYGCSLEDFDKEDINIKPLKLSFRAKKLEDEEIRLLAILNDLAHENENLAKLVEVANDR